MLKKGDVRGGKSRALSRTRNAAQKRGPLSATSIVVIRTKGILRAIGNVTSGFKLVLQRLAIARYSFEDYGRERRHTRLGDHSGWPEEEKKKKKKKNKRKGEEK